MFHDTISDMLTRIRNAGMVKHATVYIPLTRLSQQLCQILEKEGYINSFRRESVIQSANIRPPLIVLPKPPKDDLSEKPQDTEDTQDPNDAKDALASESALAPEEVLAPVAVTLRAETESEPEVTTKSEVKTESETVKASEAVPEVEAVASSSTVIATRVATGSEVFLAVELKYSGAMRKPSITNLRRISKPGLRIYTRAQDIPQVLGGMGILILSTSQGLMTDREARARRLGGEILCSVW